VIQTLASLLGRYGYAIVALFLIAEGCGIPVPSATMLVTAAALASSGTLSIWGVGIAAAVGGVVGGTAGYFIGELGGQRLIRRYGKKLRIDDERLANARKFFERHGLWAAFLARFLAFLRIVVPMFAGVARMPFPSFSAANTAGAIASAATYCALGWFFGRDLRALEHHLTRLTLTVLALLAIWLIVHQRRARR
jgi:membrane protein DedA with SNARE-associated domain